jgi:hypothetical protein
MRGVDTSERPDVYALTRPHVVRRAPLLEGTPVSLLAVLALLAAGAWVLAAADLVPPGHARAVAAGVAQGGLLATAVAWIVTRRDPAGDFVPVGVAVVAMLGAVGAAAAPFGAVAYLLAPLWLWRRRARLVALGLGAAEYRLILAGVGLGAILGLHLAITASLTLGYRVGRAAVLELGPWLAYDLGANVLAAECFFRGALFDRAQRRWSFGVAAALSTAACVARYLVDPLLPRTLEVIAGAAFYVALLSAGNCWLYWRSGSVVPGLAAGVVFFTVYRLLHVVR